MDRPAPDASIPELDALVERVMDGVISCMRGYGTSDVFKYITSLRSDVGHYPFVLDADYPMRVVAHGAIPGAIGLPASVFEDADRPREQILADLERDGNTWIEYFFYNPHTDAEEFKRSLFVLHDGYMVGAGHYPSPDVWISSVVARIIAMYDAEGGQATFDYVDSMRSDNPDYPFVLHNSTLAFVAHGADPDSVGSVPDFLVGESDLQQQLIDILPGDLLWIEYVATNPYLQIEQRRRALFVEHDGYLFSAGHHISPVALAERTINEAISLYDNLGANSTFAKINEGGYDDDTFPAVLNSEFIVVAHGQDPSYLGLSWRSPENLESSVVDLLAVFETGRVWVEYTVSDPLTDMDLYRRDLWVAHDGYVFTAGYEVTSEIRVQNVVGQLIDSYRANAQETIEGVDQLRSRNPHYPLILDASDLSVVANGADRLRYLGGDRNSTTIFDYADRSKAEIVANLKNETRTWAVHLGSDPFNPLTHYKRTWMVEKYGLIFASGYEYPSERWIVDTVDSWVERYDVAGGNQTFAEINMLETRDPAYPFVIHLNDRIVVAHGELPGAVNNTSQLLSIAAREEAEILNDLQTNGHTFIEYPFYSPAVDIEQTKRTYLRLHDGYMFGSGYYITRTSMVKALLSDTILEYNATENKDAVLEKINGLNSTDPIYPFVLNATTLEVVAEGAFPELRGTSGGDFIFHGSMTPELFRLWTADGSTIVVYPFENPATGTVQFKTAFFKEADGYFFVSGYYLTGMEEIPSLVDYDTFLYDRYGQRLLDFLSYPLIRYPGSGYPFVLDGNLEVLASRADIASDPVGLSTILENLEVPKADLLETLNRENGTWVRSTTEIGGIPYTKNIWMVLHSELVFGASYHQTPDIRATDMADIYYAKFREEGKDVLGEINGIDDPNRFHILVLNGNGTTVSADGSDRNTEGKPSSILDNADRQREQILADLDDRRHAWIVYDDPDTPETESMRIWLLARFGHIFASGYDSSCRIVQAQAGDGAQVGELDFLAQSVADAAVCLYESEGSFTAITALESGLGHHPFVMERAEPQNIVAHGSVPGAVGLPSAVLDGADRPREQILAELDREGHAWVGHFSRNPESDAEEYKRTRLLLHGSHIFGAGHHPEPDVWAQHVLTVAVRLYQAQGAEGVSARISAAEGGGYETLSLLNAATLDTVADGADPERAGLPPRFLDEAPGLAEDLLSIPEGGFLWIEYDSTDPRLQVDLPRRTLFVEYDGYLFGSGYAVTPEGTVGGIIDAAISAYDTAAESGDGQDVFDAINGYRAGFDGNVLSVADGNWTTVAHSGHPLLVGMRAFAASPPDVPLPDLLSALKEEGMAWVDYAGYDRLANEERPRRALLVYHDDYIFIADYQATPETRAQNLAFGAAADYLSDQSGAVESINALNSQEPEYPFILNATDYAVVADGAYPENVGNASNIAGLADIPDNLRGAGAWLGHSGPSPPDGLEKHRRAWLVERHGLVFGAGYLLPPEQRIHNVVNDAVDAYGNDGADTTFDMINAMNADDQAYPFVLNATTLEIVAHGAFPGVVGGVWDALERADRLAEQILQNLESENITHAEYQDHNPEAGFDQQKHSLLVLHDGYVFGSGYHPIPETLSAELAYKTTREYAESGRQATLARINSLLATDSPYPFVLRAPDGQNLEMTVAAEGAYPDRAGTPGSFVLGGNLDAERLLFLSEIGPFPAIYPFPNPATGTVQHKSAFFVGHDGHLFGAGHYVSSMLRAESVADHAADLFDRFGDLPGDPGPAHPGPAYPFVLNATDLVVIASDGAPGSDPVPIAAVLGNLTATTDDILVDLDANGSAWVESVFNSTAVDKHTKHIRLVQSGDHIFGSGYYLTPDIRAQNTVDRYVDLYRENGQSAFSEINGLNEDGRFHVIVLNATDLAINADGSGRNGENNTSNIINGTARPWTDVLADLDGQRQTWITYDDPDTMETESWRIWLVSKFGYFFGSGYTG